MAEITSFFTIIWNSCYGLPDRLNPPQNPKPCAIAHENGQKWPESWFFYDFVKLVLRGPGTFKSTLDPKTVCYISRKRLEMAWITSFLWFRKTRVTGSGSFKSTLDSKTVCYSPWNRPEMAWITSFVRFYETRFTGFRTVWIHPGPQNREQIGRASCRERV